MIQLVTDIDTGILMLQRASSWFNNIFNKILQVEMHVRLPPPASNDAPTYIPSFEMDLPSFSTTIGDLQNSYEFGHFALKTANKPVQLKVRLILYRFDGWCSISLHSPSVRLLRRWKVPTHRYMATTTRAARSISSPLMA